MVRGGGGGEVKDDLVCVCEMRWDHNDWSKVLKLCCHGPLIYIYIYIYIYI